MNRHIMRALGFGKEVDLIEKGHCPNCEKEINMNDFTELISFKEFFISGLCQHCQNIIFKSGSDDSADLKNLFEMIDSGRYSNEDDCY